MTLLFVVLMFVNLLYESYTNPLWSICFPYPHAPSLAPGSLWSFVTKASGIVLWYLEFYLLDIDEFPIETDLRGFCFLEVEKSFKLKGLF